MTSDNDFSEDRPDPTKKAITGWVTHKGPANWFRFQCPAGYRVRQQETFIEIASVSSGSLGPAESGPPDGAEAPGPGPGPTLVIFATWTAEDESQPGMAATDVAALFPETLAIRSEPSLQLKTSNQVWSGLSRRLPTGSWWRRWLTRKPLYQWRCWSIVHSRIRVLATVQSAPGRPLPDEFVACCGHILHSLELTDSPAWPPELFRRQVIKLATDHFPLLRVSSAGAFSIRIDDSEINLANFYRSYLQQPNQFRRIVLPGITTVVRLQELGPDQIMPGLDQARHRILPMLSPESLSQTEDSIQVPWVGGLCVSFVLDEDESYRFVHRQMMQQWQLTIEQLHELAIENLRNYAVDHPLEVTMVGDSEDPRLLMPVRPNAYNCARLLDPGFHGRLRELFGPELIVGIPNRDFFVAVSLKHPSLIQQVRRRVVDDYTNMHHPLTRRLLVISADGVSEYCQETV